MLVRMKVMKTGLLLAGGLVAAAFGGPAALALELGELSVSSTINEPLAASIELLDVAGLQAAQIEIALGDAAEFQQAGLEQALLLSGIRFEVQTSGSTGTVRLSTADNVVEPFLTFVLSASWPNGRQVREYTLLLDLPTFSQAPAAQVVPAAAQGAAPASTNATSATADYIVGAGDTLWEIARNTRPDASVSMEQMMLAIQRANPAAFVNNNVNRIRSGQVLRIPPLQDIAAIGQEAAQVQIAQQNSELALQPLAAGGAGTGGQRTQQDELTLLSGVAEATPGPDPGELATTIAELEMALMMSEESLDRARLEYEELNARLASLDAEIVLLRNIIEVEDQLLAQLQAELAAQASSAPAAATQEPPPPAGLASVLQNTAALLGVLLALVLAVVGILVLKRRRSEAEMRNHDYDQFQALDGASAGPAAAAAVPPAFATASGPTSDTGAHASTAPPQPAGAPEIDEVTDPAATTGADEDVFDLSVVHEPEAYSVTEEDAPAQVPADPDAFEFRPAQVRLGSEDDSLPDVAAGNAAFPGEADYSAFDDTMQFADDEEIVESAALSGQDEYDTKLDLATAFEAMGEIDDALQILDEVIAEGDAQQAETARQLKQRWQSAV